MSQNGENGVGDDEYNGDRDNRSPSPRQENDEESKLRSSRGEREYEDRRSPIRRPRDSSPRVRREYSPRREERPSYRKPREQDSPAPASDVLAIFNLGAQVTEANLEEWLSAEAPVQNINLLKNKHSGIPRGFAFVTFNSIEDATRVKDALHNSTFHDKEVRIDFSRTPHAHEATPGRYMGRRSPPRHSYRSHPYGRDDGYYRPRDFGPRDGNGRGGRDRYESRGGYRDREYRDSHRSDRDGQNGDREYGRGASSSSYDSYSTRERDYESSSRDHHRERDYSRDRYRDDSPVRGDSYRSGRDNRYR